MLASLVLLTLLPGPPPPLPADTLWVTDLSRPRLLELRDGRVSTGIRLGLKPLRLLPLGDRLRQGLPDAVARLPWIASRSRLPTVRDPREPRWSFAQLAAADFLGDRIEAGAGPPPPVRFLPAAEAGSGPLDFAQAMQEFTELGMRVQTRAELGGDWTRFRPCTDQFQESCQPQLLPQLSPDLTFAVQVDGTVLDRVSVNVDYDRLREFGGTNTLSLVYEGSEDDILQRLEVGDVTFRLPRSRFVTQGVPAGNFGFQLEGQLGPVDFRSVWAEQRGDVSSREFSLTGVGQDRRFVQADTLVLDDADYAAGQFYFLVDPDLITDAPYFDVLALDAGSAPASVVPGFQPIQLYRYDANPVARQQVEGYIQADAVAEDGADQVVESAWFRQLIPGQDYFVHPSGLWVGLRTPLNRDEMLAVTYITALGDTIGDYNPEDIYNAGGRPRLQLLKATDPNHQPRRPTWERELRQIYRISTSPDVEPASVQVTVSLGELSAGRTFKRAPSGIDITYLQLFGLDQESPIDQVDPGFVYTPGAELFQDPPAVPGTFLVFPSLEPFREPGPVRSLGLTALDAQDLLAEDANDRIYTAEDPFERRNGGLFRITIPYRVRSEGVISTFSLGALGVLEGSERILLGDRLLVQGVDYLIDYDAGLVTLEDPDGLFATAPNASIRATWEQQQVFRTAPTSVFAFNAHGGDAERGEIDLLALYQSERTLVNRPILGLEPAAVFLAGVSGRVQRSVGWLDQLLGRVPGLRVGEASSFDLQGEVAVSLPTPNTQGAVFLDDFDGSDARPLSLLSEDWLRGAPVESREGAEDILPLSVDETVQAPVSWQHRWILEGPDGDSVGIHEGFLPREEVDQQIRVAGTQIREAGLRLIMDTPPGVSQWSALTTVLNPTGTDLTRSEFLEFYVAGGDNASLVVDLGTVSEDVLFTDDQGNLTGTKENGVPWGFGILDQEADPARGQVWGNALDELGVWGESCVGEPGRIFRLGDERANCTASNGRNDSEDLDRDGNLDTAERSLRYVVELDGTSPFLARSRAETGTDFRLYRIPIRAAGIEVNGPVTEADLRAIRHLRVTVVAQDDADLTFARMRIVGSRWIRRIGEGVLTGIVGDTAAFVGRAEVRPASRITEGDGYASPPGVLEELSDPTTAVGGQGVEFNESSLSLRVTELQPGDRGEVFTRFPQRPRNFLTYREARLWVLPRRGDWSPARPVSFFLKIGTNDENFYLFRTPLRAPAGEAGVAPVDWLPEVVVDFDAFIDLRTRAEEQLIFNPRGPGDPPVILFSADSAYAVVLTDRGRAPDLANVRELSFGIWNQDDAPFDGEVWINELRLSRGDRDPGFAGVVQGSLAAGDVLQTDVTFSRRAGTFRQLREAPSYQTDQRLTVSSRARLDRLAPAEWGVEIPFTFSLDRSEQDPQFLNNSDVAAPQLPDLRDIGSRRAQMTLGIRKVTPSANPWIGALVDGLEANVAAYRVNNYSIASRVESQGLDARVGYARRLEPREFDPIPSFLEPLARLLLPRGLEESVLGSRIRWLPERFSVGTAYLRRDDDIFRFERIVSRQEDPEVVPTPAPREGLEVAAAVVIQPVASLTGDVTFRSQRDLLRPAEAVADPATQALIGEERARFLGLDVGWETNRSVTSRLRYGPRIWSWLQNEVVWSTRYAGQRNALFVAREVDAQGDSVFNLQQNTRVERTFQSRLSLDAGAVVRTVWGADAPGGLAAFLGAFKPLSYNATDGVTSRFNRAAVDPGLGYQFALLSVQELRLLQQDTAVTLTDGLSQRLGWGFGGSRASLDVAWAQSDVQALDARADREILSRTWPDLRGRISDIGGLQRVAPGLDRVSLSLGFVRNERETRLARGFQTRSTEEVNLPWDVTLTWVGSLVTAYRGSILGGEGRDPTGDTERDRVTHRMSISSSFRPPFGLARRTDGPVQLSVIGSYGSERECRVPRNRPDCVAFIDQINRALSLSLSTRMSEFQVGLQASFTDRRSFIGRRPGSTQFQLSLFGQFLFEAGALASGSGFPGVGS